MVPDLHGLFSRAGLISNNIRKPLLGCCFGFIECCIGCWNLSVEDYANELTPIIFHPELDKHRNIHFNNQGQVIHKTPEFTEAHVEEVLARCDQLVAKAAQNKA